MTKRHQACQDLIDLTEAILELLHDESVIAAAAAIDAGPSHSALVLACEQLQGRAETGLQAEEHKSGRKEVLH